MRVKNKRIKYHLVSTLLIGIFAFPTGLIFCEACRSSPQGVVTIGLYSSILWIVLWKGNEAVADSLDLKWDWGKEPLLRLITGLLGHIMYTVFAIYILNFSIFKLFGWNSELQGLDALIQFSVPAIFITIFIASIMTARGFFLGWRQLAVNEEQMKKELVIAQYEALKNQVNPHFLFNSLNVLTSLVYKDAELSAKFIKRLSNVYRYVLDVKDEQLVGLDQERDFLESYSFLLKIRHQEGLTIQIDLPEESKIQVVPLALQMLVENAVKHNSISTEHPLKIEVFGNHESLIVRNNLQKKPITKSDNSELGLANIKARYQILTDKAVSIKEDNSTFEVKIPILTLDK